MQAAEAISGLMMSSPVKQPTFALVENKENISDEVAVPVKGIPMQDEPELETAKTSVAPTIKEDESIEPILQENAQRFVLFPIKYHEVRVSDATSSASITDASK